MTARTMLHAYAWTIGVVLLKNDNTLPWTTQVKTIAVLGPNANDTEVNEAIGFVKA